MNRTATAVMPRTYCMHWWVIKEASGPMSKGRCKFCGAKKLFVTSATTFEAAW